MIGDVTVIAGSVAIATAFSEINHIKSSGAGSMQPIIGGMVLGAFLLFIAIWSTDVASALSLLVLATSALINGKAVFGSVGTIIHG